MLGGREVMEEIYLQDSFIDKIEAPRLPITHPIFPGGTSRTERISSSGTLPSTTRLSTKTTHPDQYSITN